LVGNLQFARGRAISTAAILDTVTTWRKGDKLGWGRFGVVYVAYEVDEDGDINPFAASVGHDHHPAPPQPNNASDTSNHATRKELPPLLARIVQQAA